MASNVDHPAHYNTGRIEVIDAIEDWKLNFNCGNAVKYVARADHKGRRVEDLRKAIWYLSRELASFEPEIPAPVPPRQPVRRFLKKSASDGDRLDDLSNAKRLTLGDRVVDFLNRHSGAVYHVRVIADRLGCSDRRSLGSCMSRLVTRRVIRRERRGVYGARVSKASS